MLSLTLLLASLAHGAPTLGVDLVLPGDPVTLTVDGATPDALLVLLATARGPGSVCHPTRPVCADLDGPEVLGTVRADRSGHATLTSPTPRRLPPQVWFQAVAIHPTGDEVSGVVSRIVGDPEGFPRVAAQWLWDDGSAGAFELARYRVLLEGGALQHAAWREGIDRVELRQRMLALGMPTTLLNTGDGPDYNTTYGPIPDPYSQPDFFLGDAMGNLHTHWTNPTLYALNVARPTVRQAAIGWNLDRDAVDGTRAPVGSRIFDGLFVDSMERNGEYFAPSGTVDLDRDGVDESHQDFRRGWAAGVDTYADELRAALGPNTVFMVNGSGTFDARAGVWDHATLAIDEHGLNSVYGDTTSAWTSLVQSLAARGDLLEDPHGVVVGMEATGGPLGPPDVPPVTATETELARTNWARMRFGLGSALLAGQTYFYDWGASSHGHPWWYDEYGGVPGIPVGWLGRPTGPAAPVSLPSGTSIVPSDDALAMPSAWGSWCYMGTGPVRRASADALVGATSLAVDVTRPVLGDDGWIGSCNVSTLSTFPVTAGEVLTVSFDARAETFVDGSEVAGRLIQMQVQTASTFVLIGDMPPVLVTPDWRHYEVSLPITTSGTARFDVALANADGTVWVDGISVRRGAPSPVWSRAFERGLVLVNGSGADATVAVPAGYRRLEGSQVPGVNDGSAVVGSVLVPAWDAVVLGR